MEYGASPSALLGQTGVEGLRGLLFMKEFSDGVNPATTLVSFLGSRPFSMAFAALSNTVVGFE